LVDLLFSLQQNEEDAHHREAVISQLLGQLNLISQNQKGFQGILGKCCITGCDVHALSPSQVIMEHYLEGQPVPEIFLTARTALNNAPSSVLAFLVFDNRLIALFVDGTSKAWG
jgi:hypothetical protein